MRTTKVWFLFAAVFFLVVTGCEDKFTPELTEEGVGEETSDVTTPGVGEETPTVTPPVPVAKYVLTVDLQGSLGAVSSEPEGIDCTEDCSAEFPSGTTVILDYAGSTGSRFKQWSENCAVPEGYSGPSSVIPPCAIVLDGDKTVIATFELAPTPPPVLPRIEPRVKIPEEPIRMPPPGP